MYGPSSARRRRNPRWLGLRCFGTFAMFWASLVSSPDSPASTRRNSRVGANPLVVRAIHARQGNHDVYSFFIRGPQLLEIADISRIAPDEKGSVTGFQRKPIRAQVRAIAEYVSRGDVLFPNAIVLALASNVKYVAARGPSPRGSDDAGEAGTLTIPASGSAAAAWIVDGQQRALALAENRADHLVVPVVAFVSEAIATQREQFILVNKARPLSRRLIDELLPEVNFPLPRDLRSEERRVGKECGD